jgi:hypothetical protein
MKLNNTTILFYEDLYLKKSTFYKKFANILQCDELLIRQLFSTDMLNVKNKTKNGVYSKHRTLSMLVRKYIAKTKGCNMIYTSLNKIFYINILRKLAKKIPISKKKLHHYPNNYIKSIILNEYGLSKRNILQRLVSQEFTIKMSKYNYFKRQH